MKIATTPNTTRPLAKQTMASEPTTATVIAVTVIEVGSSSPNGRVPSTTRRPNATVATTASNEDRPSSLQYTSCKPHPQRELVEREAGPDAEADRHEMPPRRDERGGEGEEAAEEHEEDAPDEVVVVDAGRVSTPPGHQETLRVSRALVRIAR